MENLLSHPDFKEDTKRRWKAQIIRVATLAFKKKGYHGTTMDDIAKQLNITKGSLYYYFKNKEAILFDCHMASLDIVIGIIEEVKKSDQSPSAKLYTIIYRYLKTMLEELLGSTLLLEEEALSPGLLQRVIRRRDYAERSIREILADGMRTGEFKPGNPKLLTFAILGAMNWTSKWYHPSGEKSASEIAQAFADYLVAGLRKQDPNAHSGGGP